MPESHRVVPGDRRDAGPPGDEFLGSRSGFDVAALAGLLHDSPLGVLLLESMNIVDANPAACVGLGRPRNELVGRPLHQFAASIQPDGRGARESLELRIETALRVPDPSGIPWCRCAPDGSLSDAELQLSCTRRGNTIHSLVLMRDAESARPGEPAASRSGGRTALLSQLCGGIAHDLNNLLTAIDGNLELAQGSSAANSRQGAFLGTARSCAGKAGALSRRLLDYSRDRLFEPRPVSINALLEQTAGFLRRIIRRDVMLTLHTTADLPPVSADAGQLEQALMNLVFNAEDAVPHGGRISLRSRVMHTDVEFLSLHPWVEPGRYVAIEVEDTGRGIDDAAQAHVFKANFTTKRQGTGLGLSLVYGIAKLHRGYVGVRSAPGQGSLFWILLPPFPAGLGEIDAEIESIASSACATTGRTILVVEDEDVVRRLAVTVLRRNGYRVMQAESAEVALDLFCEHHDEIDLVVTDVLLSGLNGCELVADLRKRKPELRVLFTSGHAAEQYPGNPVFEPCTAFLEKPYTLDELVTQVARVLAGDGPA